MRAPTFLFVLFVLGAWSSANAIILFGGDNTVNLTDPGSGVPFDAVARVTNSAGTQAAGTAIHLGGGYMLTANHVSLSGNNVTFDGTTYYQRDISFAPIQVSANVDMKIFKLSSTPTTSAVSLYSEGLELVANATVIGWGVGRNDSIPINTHSVTWGDSSTIDKRWGINVPKSLVNVAYQSGSYQAIETIAGSSSGIPAGVGANEAAMTLYDSGSALFQEISGTWYLIGLTTAVSTSGSSTFGNDTTVSGGDGNFFARISTYSGDINAIIPEPSDYAALLGVILLGMAITRRRLRLS